MNAKKKKNKVLKIILDVLTYAFLVLCIFVVIITVTSKRSPDGASNIFGYEMRVVLSDSMDECEYTDVSKFEIGSIPKDAVVFLDTVPEDPAEANEWYSTLKPGDVLTFRYVYGTQKTITHRITSIKKLSTGGYEINLAGDNKNSEDQLEQTIYTAEPNATNYVIGKVTGSSYPVGVVMTFLKSAVGIIFCIIVPCLAIILIEVVKIIKVLGADKKERANEEKQQQQNELEELRRRLAELEAQKNSSENQPTDKEETQ